MKIFRYLFVFAFVLLLVSGCASEKEKLYKSGQKKEQSYNLQGAIEDYEKLLEIDENYLQAYPRIIKCCFEINHYLRAEGPCYEWSVREANNPKPYLIYGVLKNNPISNNFDYNRHFKRAIELDNSYRNKFIEYSEKKYRDKELAVFIGKIIEN